MSSIVRHARKRSSDVGCAFASCGRAQKSRAASQRSAVQKVFMVRCYATADRRGYGLAVAARGFEVETEGKLASCTDLGGGIRLRPEFLAQLIVVNCTPAVRHDN